MKTTEDKIYNVLFNNFSGVVSRDALENIAKEITNVSAAPELLEALQDLANLYDTDEGCRSTPEYINARAAIAKATGQK